MRALREPQLGRLVVLTQWSLPKRGWGSWHLCPANIERAIYEGELDHALCGAKPSRAAVVREAAIAPGIVPAGRLCQRCEPTAAAEDAAGAR